MMDLSAAGGLLASSVISGLAAGVYHVVLQDGEGRRWVKKLLKE